MHMSLSLSAVLITSFFEDLLLKSRSMSRIVKEVLILGFLKTGIHDDKMFAIFCI